MLDVGDFIKIEKLTCRLSDDEDGVRSFRFSIQSGTLQKLNVNSDAVKSMMVRLKDVPGDSQEDSYLANILDAINKDGSFIAPFSQSERLVSSTQENQTVPSLPSPVVKDHTSLQSGDLSPASLPLAQAQPSPSSQPTPTSASPETFSSVEISGFSQQSSSPVRPGAAVSPTPTPARTSRGVSSRWPVLKDVSATTDCETSHIRLKLRRLKVKPKPVELSTRKFSLKSSLQEASASSASLLEGDDPTVPAPPPPTVEESSEVWSQMTQFPSDDIPVRTRPSETRETTLSSQSSQSSSGSYASCRETLSEQMEEEENIPVDGMESMEIEENDSHTKTLTNNDNMEKSEGTAMEQDGNDSEDIFETSVETEEEEVLTVSSYRSNLVVTCQPSSSQLPRRDCASLPSSSPGV